MVNIEEMLKRSPVLPVVTIEDASHAVDLAQALLRGGLHNIEITLRTAAALPAIEAIARAVPDMCIGAGTVLTAADLAAAASAGATFAISPGATEALYAANGSIPWVPAIATASELMRGLESGRRCFKFFPAATAGGIAALSSLYGPFAQARFCPTGGVGLSNAAEFLRLPNVICVGGSWLTPASLQRANDWSAIEALARQSAALRTSAQARVIQ
jgi:2-dehydro-3-deoxyphosphogluconate aldolase / (4S)-4-hydroxy-2-oxoglutarate aldolase